MDEEPKLPLSQASVKDGVISFIAGVALVGWGVFRFNTRPILSGFLLFIGVMNVIFGVMNLGIALTDRRR